MRGTGSRSGRKCRRDLGADSTFASHSPNYIHDNIYITPNYHELFALLRIIISNAARECGVSVKTIREYYQILDDTLIGRMVAPWKKSKGRRLIETAKFYYFDVGIVSALLNYKTLTPGTPEYGRAFEHFVLQECWAYRHYSRLDFPIAFWRTASGAEVDLILGDADVAIEVKSTENATMKTKGLHLFSEEHRCRRRLIVSRDPVPRKLQSGVEILPWQVFCQMLWAGEII